jgi:streptogramin lyase
MSDLKERLDRELATVLPAGDARAAVDTRVARRRRRRTILLPAATLILTAGLIAGLTFAFSPDPRGPQGDARGIEMPGEPVEVMVDGGLLWVLTSEPECDGPVCDGFVVKVDEAGGQVIDQVPVTSPNGIAAGAGSIWVVSLADDTLLRLEPATGSIQATIPLSLPFTVGNDGDRSFLPVDVDANDDAVWVSSGRGALAHIDPATNDVVDMVPRRSHTGGPLAIGQEGVWVADSLNGAVLVDPATHQVVHSVTLDDEIGQRFSVNTLVARDGSVWAVGNWADPVEELDGVGYVAGEGHAVVEIDERGHDVDSILDIREGAAWLLDGDDLWVVEHDGGYLRRIDRAGRRLGPSLNVPFGRPLAVAGTSAWSAVGESLRRWELPREGDPGDRAGDLEPLVIRISSPKSEDGTYVGPRFRASYRGTPIPLDAIETPGAELEYPVTESPVALPKGTPIVIEGDVRDAAVFELRPAPGTYVEHGSCIVADPLYEIPSRDEPTAFFIYAEWPDSAGGMAFRSDVAGGSSTTPGSEQAETQIDATLLGLALCEG